MHLISGKFGKITLIDQRGGWKLFPATKNPLATGQDSRQAGEDLATRFGANLRLLRGMIRRPDFVLA